MSPLKIPTKMWRYLTDFWTFACFVISIENFRLHNSLDGLVGPAMAIYIAVLAIFSAEKEFERWHLYNTGRHRGEMYVAAWTALIIGLMIAKYFLGDTYILNSEVYSTYIVVLGVLAITRKSKEIFAERKEVEI